ncbi:MAG: hypothetical protein AABX12_04740 [Nanoarchaeota archaeon]
MRGKAESSRENEWTGLLNKLMCVTTPLFMDGELRDICEKLHELENGGALVIRGGMRVQGYVCGEYRDLSPRDPLTGAVYGFTKKPDASTWARGLQEYPQVTRVTIC